jgi:hypothetical protein
MENETRKNVVSPGLVIHLGNQSLHVLAGSVVLQTGSVALQAGLVIQINGEVPPEIVQAIVKAIEGKSGSISS